jgi:hypothetical protein
MLIRSVPLLALAVLRTMSIAGVGNNPYEVRKTNGRHGEPAL